MVVIWIVLLLVVSALLAWLALFDDARVMVSGALGRVLAASSRRLRAAWGRCSRRAGNAGMHAGAEGARWIAGLKAHRALLSVTIALLVLPVSLVLALRQNVMLDGFETTGRQHGSILVQTLLKGERLVPPPPPPPDVFLTRDVEIVRPMTATANRKWESLDADFTQVLLTVYTVMLEEHGYEMVLVEGYRSPERQNRLAARGQHVTRARGGRSWHQYGLAADSAFMRDGTLVISERDPWAMRGYQLYGQVAKEAGLVWGGDWTSIQDLMHVELRRPGVMAR